MTNLTIRIALCWLLASSVALADSAANDTNRDWPQWRGPLGTGASGSAVTDGEHVFASFGSYGLYCLDFDGKEIWRADFGLLQPLHGHGEGSSPALYGETLVVNCDHEGQSFVVALDKRTGKE